VLITTCLPGTRSRPASLGQPSKKLNKRAAAPLAFSYNSLPPTAGSTGQQRQKNCGKRAKKQNEPLAFIEAAIVWRPVGWHRSARGRGLANAFLRVPARRRAYLSAPLYKNKRGRVGLPDGAKAGPNVILVNLGGQATPLPGR